MKFLIPFLFSIVAPLALADTNPSQVLSKLRAIDQVEIKAGQLAQEKGVAKEVKTYAQRLIDDHKSLDENITKYAAENNINVADDGPTLKDKMTLVSLQNTNGANFDKKFLDSMVKGHEDAISMVKSASNDTNDPKLKTFLASVIPSLEKHHNTAEKLEKKL